MNQRPMTWTSFLGVAVVALCATVSGGAQQTAGIERVAWLQGCWEMTSAQRTVEEQWMAPRGGSMIGMSRTVRGDRLVEYELVTLREQGERLAYEAHPSGQSAAVFLSRTVTDSVVVFENPGHDFPKRVGYQRDRGGSLVAWIEGSDQGQTRRIEFHYRRVTCPGSKRGLPNTRHAPEAAGQRVG